MLNDNTIVGAGNTPDEALAEAQKKGIQSPFLLYVPDKDLVHIYYHDCPNWDSSLKNEQNS